MHKKSKIYPYLLVAPAMIGLFLFTIYPMLYLVYLSFTNWNLIDSNKKFIGFDNYIALFKKDEFIEVIFNTVEYTFFVVVIIMIISILLALWLNKSTKFNLFAQAAIFTPHIIALVSISMVWLWLMDPDVGFLNYILKFIGVEGIRWLQDSETALISIVIVSSWKSIGYYTLVILASLQSIPAEIYEAAALDNSSKVKTFFKITLPMISPQLFFLLIVMTIGSFKVFDTINIMTGGGPVNSTNMLVYYIYEYAFVHMKIGYAAAAGTVLLIIVGLVTLVYFKLLSKKVHYQ